MTKQCQDFILLIMNCKKYEYKAKVQKETWLTKIPETFKYYHVIGDENIDCGYIFNEETRTLTVKTPDDYNSLPKKVIASYQAVMQEFDFKYIFKTDDDQDLVNPYFLNSLKNILVYKSQNNNQKQIHYAGNKICVSKPYLCEYYKIHPELPKKLPIFVTTYCSGRFYILSKTALRDLLYKSELIKREYLEDYAIGFHLSDFLKETMLHIETDKYFVDIDFENNRNSDLMSNYYFEGAFFS